MHQRQSLSPGLAGVALLWIWFRWAVAVAVFGVASAGAAQAHLMPVQQGSLNVVGEAVYVVVSLPVSAVPEVDDDRDGRLSSTELTQHEVILRARLAQRFGLFDGDVRGRLDLVQPMVEPDERHPASPAGASHFLVLLKISFNAVPRALRVQTDLFGVSAREQQLTLKATRGLQTESVVLNPRRQSNHFFREPGWVFLNYIELGLEHILLGADHLMFLLVVIVGAAGWRYWLAVLTSFTVAHSLTLTAALLGWLSVPVAVVEPLIAASIVLMAFLNLQQRNAVPRQRIALVFVCGLLHGFGFAGAMAYMGLHGTHQFTSVLGFNLGIELGQALVLVTFLVAARALRSLKIPANWRHAAAQPYPVRFTSALALCTGTWWLYERLVG